MLDIDDLKAETAKVLLTVEADEPAATPSDEIVEQGVLEIR